MAHTSETLDCLNALIERVDSEGDTATRIPSNDAPPTRPFVEISCGDELSPVKIGEVRHRGEQTSIQFNLDWTLAAQTIYCAAAKLFGPDVACELCQFVVYGMCSKQQLLSASGRLSYGDENASKQTLRIPIPFQDTYVHAHLRRRVLGSNREDGSVNFTLQLTFTIDVTIYTEDDRRSGSCPMYFIMNYDGDTIVEFSTHDGQSSGYSSYRNPRNKSGTGYLEYTPTKDYEGVPPWKTECSLEISANAHEVPLSHTYSGRIEDASKFECECAKLFGEVFVDEVTRPEPKDITRCIMALRYFNIDSMSDLQHCELGALSWPEAWASAKNCIVYLITRVQQSLIRRRTV